MMNSIWLTLFRWCLRCLPEDVAKEMNDELTRVFKNKPHAGRLIFRQALGVVGAYHRERLVAYACAIRPSVVLLGPGWNGSRMTNSERFQLYTGQAAVGILGALFCTWLVYQDRLSPHIDTVPRLLSGSARPAPPGIPSGHHHAFMPMTPAEVYQFAFYSGLIALFFAISWLCWRRKEFPLLGIWVGALIGAVPTFPITLGILVTHECRFFS